MQSRSSALAELFEANLARDKCETDMKRLQEENTALRRSVDESYIDGIDFTAAKLLAYTERKLCAQHASRLEGMRQLEAAEVGKEHADEALLAQKSEAALAEATASQQLKELSTQNVQAEHTIMAERKAAENRQQIIQKQSWNRLHY